MFYSFTYWMFLFFFSWCTFWVFGTPFPPPCTMKLPKPMSFFLHWWTGGERNWRTVQKVGYGQKENPRNYNMTYTLRVWINTPLFISHFYKFVEEKEFFTFLILKLQIRRSACVIQISSKMSVIDLIWIKITSEKAFLVRFSFFTIVYPDYQKESGFVRRRKRCGSNLKGFEIRDEIMWS